MLLSRKKFTLSRSKEKKRLKTLKRNTSVPTDQQRS